MTSFSVHVRVTPHPSVPDAMSESVRGTFAAMDLPVTSVSAGKYFFIRIGAATIQAAIDEIQRVCEEVLVNPVIETYEFTLDCTAGPAGS